MKIAYLDCIGGISGDMLLGAFVAAGVNPEELKAELDKLGLRGWDINFSTVKKADITAIKADVIDQSKPVERNLLDILKIIAGSTISAGAKKRAAHVFETLATAEGAAHGQVPATVHFHEVGAVDAIIDVTGTAICLDLLGIDKLYVSSLPVSQAAPATVHILSKMNVSMADRGIENVTPTGAAIVKTLASQIPATPEMVLEKIGYGAGEADTEVPNVLRIMLGSAEKTTKARGEETAILLESNIDDISPEIMSFAMDKLFSEGARDVWFTPIIMKKGRPAFVLSCLCAEGAETRMAETMFQETGTLGIRISTVSREALHRETINVTTEYGIIRVKSGMLNGAAVSVRPEFADVAAAARKYNSPAKDVYEAAVKARSRL
jgi:pyridinium-3,5-bisthiocarboxylic acid mononucleotide nickel chelatase